MHSECAGADGTWGGGRESNTSNSRIERGPGGEQGEEPTPRVLVLLLTDGTS